ncbi:MAG: FAD-binding oxidoreductase [Alphaproteobacteria bacterium]|nr:FAD-binding oxidoreductase [Alphaproteobacteria bacterium]MCW5743616.1 FAD-binding oxidoreductase [Alphaproteobacteria bacterium]
MLHTDAPALSGTDAHPPLSASLWGATARPAPATPSLSETAEADVAIVGGGFSGLSTAISLAERGRSVRVLEAFEPGWGASGRNGGQVIPGARHLPDELVDAYGRERGERLHRWGAKTADAAFALIERLELDCEPVRTGWIQAADTETAMDESRKRVAGLQKAGAPARMLDREQFRALVGSDAYIGGWIHEGGGAVQPLSLVRELARAAQTLGVHVHGGSPATAIARDGAGWRVMTPNGSVAAPRLLMATNALTGNVWPRLREATLPVWSHQIATTPLGANARTRVIPQGQPVSDTRRVLRYFRIDGHGRLIIGGKGKASAPKDDRDFSLQRETLGRLYPDLADQPIEHGWGGQVAITVDHLPRIFALGDGAFAHIGCNGRGVAWCCAIGPVLADLLDGADPEASPMPVTSLRTIPFHQMRRLYVAVGGAWLRLRDRFDR